MKVKSKPKGPHARLSDAELEKRLAASQARIASLTHGAIYALLFARPISGWVVNSSAGFPLQWFGLVNLPHIVGRDHGLHELAEEVHEIMFWLLVLLVVAHAGAAFYHHLFQRDATLARMLPKGWLRVGDTEVTPNNTEDSDHVA